MGILYWLATDRKLKSIKSNSAFILAFSGVMRFMRGHILPIIQVGTDLPLGNRRDLKASDHDHEYLSATRSKDTTSTSSSISILLIVPLFNASILRRNTNMPSCNVKVVTYHNATRYFSTINVTSNMLRCDMQTCHLFFVATHFSQPFISSSHSFLAAIHFSQPSK
jgi:hypothetical protein